MFPTSKWKGGERQETGTLQGNECRVLVVRDDFVLEVCT